MYSSTSSDDEDEEQEDEDEPEVLVVEQYVQRVLDFSSQYGSDQSYSYTASNLVGTPSMFPAYGDSPYTFAQREFSKAFKECPSGKFRYGPYCSPTGDCGCDRMDNFVDVRFDHSVFANAVYIYETFNPGSVHQIWGGDGRGRWISMYVGMVPPSPVGHQPRAFAPPISGVATSDFPINSLRIVFNSDHLNNYSEIEAIALLGTVVGRQRMGTRVILDDKELFALRGMDLVGKVEDLCLKSVPVTDLQKLSEAFSIDLKSLCPLAVEALNQIDQNSDNDFDIVDSQEKNFLSLPGEVILYIFSLMDLISLGRCAQVCTLFREATKDPMLYTRVCLKPLFHLVNSQCLLALADKAKFLAYLDLSWVGNYGKISPAALCVLLRSCSKSLVGIRLNNCHAVDTSVMEILSTECSSVAELSLSNCHLVDTRDFEDLCSMTNLRCLNAYRTRVSKSALMKLLLSTGSGSTGGLTHLDVSSCALVHGDELCKMLRNHAPNLISLDMFRVQNLTARGVFHLANLAKLQELDVGWCNSIDYSTGCVVELIQNCVEIRKLFLTAHRQTSDREVSALCELEHLRQLDLMGTRNVSCAVVKELLERRSDQLVLLDVSYCEQLESHLEELAQLRRAYPKTNIILSHT